MWDPFEQSLALGAVYIGSSVASIPCGIVLNKLGSAKIISIISLVIWSILSFLSPLSAAQSFAAFYAIRFAIGASGVSIYTRTFRLFQI